MIAITCRCGAQLQLPDNWAGKQVKCLMCKEVLQVPAQASAVPVQAVAAPTEPPPMIWTTPEKDSDEKKSAGLSLMAKMVLGLCGAAAIAGMVVLIWFITTHQSWEKQHHDEIVKLSKETITLMQTGKGAEGREKFGELERLLGEHELGDEELMRLVEKVRVSLLDRRTSDLPSAVAVVKNDPVANNPPKSVTPATIPMPELTLLEARRKFKTVLTQKWKNVDAPEPPPPELFSIVRYTAPLGENVAYLTPDPKDGKKHPAIIWLFSGNAIGDVWTEPSVRQVMLKAALARAATRNATTKTAKSEPKKPEPADDVYYDTTGSAFRKAGIIMMYPALRGANGNPGNVEGFLGEADDVIAAGEFLAKQPYVDPSRVYLAGHSGGGTLALLVAESSTNFRVIFSFGAWHDVSTYETRAQPPVNMTNKEEIKVRSPVLWLDCVRNPTFILEGRGGGSITNLMGFTAMENANRNPMNTFVNVFGAEHSSIVEPVTKLIAAKILRDTGPTPNITLTVEETSKLFEK